MVSTSEPAPLLVWRLVKERHADNAFDGEGARLYGGRWNSPGRGIVYTSGSLALAALETLVHLDPALPLPRFLAFPVRLPPGMVAAAELPPAYSFAGPLPALPETRRIGDRWFAEGRHLAFSVPSVIVPQELNVLLNPHHPDFAKLPVGAPVAFAVDTRLRR